MSGYGLARALGLSVWWAGWEYVCEGAMSEGKASR